jgi:hypothetical protein
MRLITGTSAGLLLAGLLAGCAPTGRPAVGPHSAYNGDYGYDYRGCVGPDPCTDYRYSSYPANHYPGDYAYRPYGYGYREYGYRDCAYDDGCSNWHED